MPTQDSPVLTISMPGTIHTAAPTAMAVTIQRIMKFMITSFSSGFIMSKWRHDEKPRKQAETYR